MQNTNYQLSALVFTALAGTLILSPRLSAATGVKIHTESHAESAVAWRTDDPAKALEDAKTQGKHVFLYWGAQWCPPCNAMKSEVFNRPEFQTAIKNMLPIMIDGDSADAQTWSDRFQVSGYPTMLVLAPDGSERMRFYGYTPLVTIQAAIAAIEATSDSLATLIQKAAKSEALSDAEWRQLAYSDWSKFSDSDFGGKSPYEIALDVTKAIPAKLVVEKAMIATFIVVNAPDVKPEIATKIREQYDALFASVAANETTLVNAEILFFEGFASLKFATEEGVAPETKKQRIAAWGQAVDKLAKELDDSLSSRVNILAARVGLAKFQPVDAARTLKFREELEGQRKELDKVKDPHVLTALVPTLADAFESIGDHDVAVKVLERTASRSPTPWYFHSHAAYLIKEAGDINQAIPLYERAMRTAKGPSTRIQWTWTYLNAVDKSTVKDRSVRMESTVNDLFKLALRAPDGFNGRNLRTMNKAKDLVMTAGPQNKKLVAIAGNARKQCDALKDEQKMKSCISFFEPMAQLKPQEKATPATVK